MKYIVVSLIILAIFGFVMDSKLKLENSDIVPFVHASYEESYGYWSDCIIINRAEYYKYYYLLLYTRKVRWTVRANGVNTYIPKIFLFDYGYNDYGEHLVNTTHKCYFGYIYTGLNYASWNKDLIVIEELKIINNIIKFSLILIVFYSTMFIIWVLECESSTKIKSKNGLFFILSSVVFLTTFSLGVVSIAKYSKSDELIGYYKHINNLLKFFIGLFVFNIFYTIVWIILIFIHRVCVKYGYINFLCKN